MGGDGGEGKGKREERGGEALVGVGLCPPKVKFLVTSLVCSDAMNDVGALVTCEAIQLQSKALLVKSSQCLGSDVSSWQPSDIRTIGVIIGTLRPLLASMRNVRATADKA